MAELWTTVLKEMKSISDGKSLDRNGTQVLIHVVWIGEPSIRINTQCFFIRGTRIDWNPIFFGELASSFHGFIDQAHLVRNRKEFIDALALDEMSP
jgi:hypothetical protein